MDNKLPMQMNPKLLLELIASLIPYLFHIPLLLLPVIDF